MEGRATMQTSTRIFSPKKRFPFMPMAWRRALAAALLAAAIFFTPGCMFLDSLGLGSGTSASDEEEEEELAAQEQKVAQLKNQITTLDEKIAGYEAKIKQAEHVLCTGSGGGADSMTDGQLGGRYGVEVDIKNWTKWKNECEEKRRSLKSTAVIEEAKLRKIRAAAPERPSPPPTPKASPETECRLADQRAKVSQMETRLGQIDSKINELKGRIKQAEHVLSIGSGGGASSITEPQLGGRYGVEVDIKNWTSMIRTLEEEKAEIRQSLPKEKIVLKSLENKAQQEIARNAAASAGSEAARRAVRPPSMPTGGGCSHGN
jgi:septal ring factor EnvC (AmiA/AmiB activator)